MIIRLFGLDWPLIVILLVETISLFWGEEILRSGREERPEVGIGFEEGELLFFEAVVGIIMFGLFFC